ncbi:helix-turn-helix domain-containing protein [Urbifossiella limnaea]|uniref:Anaerobic benzoate catabolism transcriptional regulator n=1 Tax=Urbifossiella limnaea TaxID=2528023 RepID=A0A517Y0S4_9BACT|nr:helix-turn-helix transcriptional regulator [Urbifossiella limnaea]QDU23308.1 anaerobic benzoate catabolism transcriptional regulator [Urbifossiella limnaea]
MAKKGVPIRHAGVVERFAARLRELRLARGMTQADLAQQASVTPNYVGKLENAGAAPGIDLVERLGVALGVTASDLLQSSTPSDPRPVLRDQARRLLDRVAEDDHALTFLVPLLARLAGGPGSL